MADNAHVLCTIKGNVHELTLDNPSRKNALSLALLDNLNEKLSATRDNEARTVILTGCGGVFSAGADFADLTGTIDDLEMDDAIEQIVNQIRSMPAAVIAAIEGPCMGGAVDIALACDFLVASKEAFFEVPAARLGLLYNPNAVTRWRARLNGLTLRRMLLMGERFTAAEAVQAGVVSHLVAEGYALEKSRELAARISQGNRDAVAASKSLLVALESGETNLAYWEKIRKKILGSQDRHKSVSRAKDVAWAKNSTKN